VPSHFLYQCHHTVLSFYYVLVPSHCTSFSNANKCHHTFVSVPSHCTFDQFIHNVPVKQVPSHFYCTRAITLYSFTHNFHHILLKADHHTYWLFFYININTQYISFITLYLLSNTISFQVCIRIRVTIFLSLY